MSRPAGRKGSQPLKLHRTTAEDGYHHDRETDVTLVFRGVGVLRSRLLHASSGSNQGEGAEGGEGGQPVSAGGERSAGLNSSLQLFPAVDAQDKTRQAR